MKKNYCYIIFERTQSCQSFYREFIAPNGQREYNTLKETRTAAKLNNVKGVIMKYDFLRGYQDKEYQISIRPF